MLIRSPATEETRMTIDTSRGKNSMSRKTLIIMTAVAAMCLGSTAIAADYDPCWIYYGAAIPRNLQVPLT
jgi:hypothetical protein